MANPVLLLVNKDMVIAAINWFRSTQNSKFRNKILRVCKMLSTANVSIEMSAVLPLRLLILVLLLLIPLLLLLHLLHLSQLTESTAVLCQRVFDFDTAVQLPVYAWIPKCENA